MSDLLTDVMNYILMNTDEQSVEGAADMANEIILMCNRAYRTQQMGERHARDDIRGGDRANQGDHERDRDGGDAPKSAA